MYAKHNIYWGIYETEDESARINEAEWIVMKYRGTIPGFGVFTADLSQPGRIALILNDGKNEFWAVISFLTKDEVKDLIKKLQKALEVED